MKTIYVYAVEGFERFDKRTGNYEEVRKIEVIAESEREALKKAEKVLKCKNYMVMACYERITEKEFTDDQKKQMMDLLFRIAVKLT